MADNNNYETRTNLLSCADIVAYMWAKYSKTEPAFKPEGATRLESEIEYEDVQSGDKIKKTYQISKEDLAHSSIKGKEEYEVNILSFKTLNQTGEICSEGRLLVVYKGLERFYILFLLEDDDEKITLKLKLSQKKKLFQSMRKTSIEEF